MILYLAAYPPMIMIIVTTQVVSIQIGMWVQDWPFLPNLSWHAVANAVVGVMGVLPLDIIEAFLEGQEAKKARIWR